MGQQTRIAKAREELLELKLRSDSLNLRTLGGELRVEQQTRIAKAREELIELKLRSDSLTLRTIGGVEGGAADQDRQGQGGATRAQAQVR